MTSSNWFNLFWPWTSRRTAFFAKAGASRLFFALNFAVTEFNAVLCYPNGTPFCSGVNFNRPQALFDFASSVDTLRAAHTHRMDKESRIYPEAAAIG